MVAAATPAVPLDAIQAQIQGEISGQVAVGRHILQVGSIHGALITVLPAEPAPRFRPRPTPLFVRPHPFPGLLDRSAEVAAATGALQAAQPVELHGEAGVGKTSLLRHLAFHPGTGLFRDGVICLPARGQPAADLLQSLFDVFVERDGDVKPTDGELHQALSDTQALVLLDDVDLARDDLQLVMDAAPGCTFLLASVERRLWGEGRAFALAGLPEEDALSLLERELGRPLADDERPSAHDLCAALQGHPLRLLQAAALAREEGLTLAAACRRLRPDRPGESLAQAVVAPLAEPEARTLAAIAALGGASIGAEHLAAIVEIPALEPVLDVLARRNLVMAASPRFVATVTPATPDLATWQARAVAHYAAWAEERASTPAAVTDEVAVILELLAAAMKAGNWRDALRLGRAVDAPLSLAGRWGIWEQVLRQTLAAARALGERAIEAWSLHQLGTRALALGDTAAAVGALTQALQLREALGDELGAAVTRHNLGALLGPPVAPREPLPAAGPAAAPVAGLATLVKVVAGLIVAALIGAGGWYLASGVAAPSGLSAAAVSDTGVSLRWTDNATNEDGFVVERRVNDSPFVEIARVGADVEDLADTGLQPDTTYVYRVRAYRGWMPGLPARQSGPSNEADATPGVLLPLEGLAVEPAAVSGETSASGTVTLGRAALTGGATVRLSTSHPDLAAVPDSVTVAPGETAASFPIATHRPSEATEVTITASLGDAEQTATLTVEPPVPTLSGVRVEPARVTGGEVVTGTLSLSGPAPAGGVNVALSSDRPAVLPMPQDGVSVAAGDTLATFTAETTTVDVPTEVTIAASLGGERRTATVTVLPGQPPPPGLSDLTCDATLVTGGQTVTCAATLTGAAPAEGVTIRLTSANPAVVDGPATVEAPSGQARAPLTLTTGPVTAPTDVVIAAAVGDVTKEFTLTVLPPALAGLTCRPSPVTGGGAATCVVSLSGKAPQDGISVTVRSTTRVATPDVADVLVRAGDASAPFGVHTETVAAATQAGIVASLGGAEKSFSLEVVPAALPDLVVPSLQATGAPSLAPDGSVKLPVRVIVRNAGSADAGVFKVATVFSGQGGTFVVAFTVPGQGNSAYPYTDGPLAPGREVTFAGSVTFSPSGQGQTVSLRAIADSCAGDEFQPAFCRVAESDETNNGSVPIAVALPLAPPSGVTAGSTANGVQLRWTDVTRNETGFEIQRRVDAGSFVAIATVAADATAYLDAALGTATLPEGAHTFTYRLRAFTTGGLYSAYSNQASVTIQVVH